MIPNFKEILSELSYRVEGGIPDLNKESHVNHLIDILKENGIADAAQLAQKARVYFSYLNEANQTPLKKLLQQKVKNTDTGRDITVASALAYKDNKNVGAQNAYKAASAIIARNGYDEKDIDMVDDENPEEPNLWPDKEETPKVTPNTISISGAEKRATKSKSQPNQQYVSKTGTKEMESRDGNSFEGYRSGKMKAPGTPAGAFAEVGGMKIAGYLREHPNASDEELAKYISDWAKAGKVTKSPSVSGGDKLTAAVNTGRAIFEMSNNISSEENYDPKTTMVEGYWGSEESKTNAINRVKEIVKKNPKATFNGLSAEQYIGIINKNGAGENPTDTMMIIWDGKSNNVSMLHVSNKIGSNNIQANSTVKQTYDRMISIVHKSKLNPQEKEVSNKIIQKHQLNGVKLQEEQKAYQTSFLPKYQKLTSTPAGLKALTNDIYEEGGLVRRGPEVDKMFTGTGAIGKLCKKMDKPHPGCKLIDNPKATPAAKVKAMFEIYTKYPQSAPAPVREIISRTATISGKDGKPKYKTGYNSEVINSMYGKMNDEVEGMRRDLNKIQNGLGDRMLAHDFASRLHLTIAEGHNPGGIPANRFQLVMGNNEADIWYDKQGQAYQKIKGGYHKVMDDGSLDKNPSKISQREVTRGNIATIGDVNNFQHCLGVPTGKKIEESINVKYDKINTKTGIQTAHVFDIAGREVGIMTIRTKSGPGGDANDTIQFSKEMQNCMQKQEYIKKRNKK